MKKNCLLLFCLLFLATGVSAQEFAVLIERANLAFCKGDTATAIAFLEEHVKKYPTDASTLLANHYLGRFYLHRGDYQAAFACLTNALEQKIENKFLIREPKDCHELSSRNYVSLKADICVTLSQIHQRLNEPQKALEYLDLADGRFLPRYGGCANGMIMYRTYLSLFYADVYLQAGDTARAVNRLLEYFMSDEAHQLKVAAKLKTCLRARFSQKQINREIKKAIVHLKAAKIAENGTWVQGYSFTLFGYTRKFKGGSAQHCRHYLEDHPSLKLLRDG